MKALENLLKPISTDAPCGIDIEETPPYATEFQTLASLNRAGNNQDFSSSKTLPTPTNWQEIEQLSLSLFQAGKHLRLAVYLCSAWLHTKNLEGFAKGLRLVRQLTEQYWEDVYPRLTFDDEFDADFRINTLNNLCDRETIINPLTRVTLVSIPGLGSYSLRDYKLALGETPPIKNEKPPTLGQIEAAIAQQAPEDAHKLLSLVSGIRADIKAIENQFDNKLTGKPHQPLKLLPLSKELMRIEKLLQSHSQVESPLDNPPLFTESSNKAAVVPRASQPGEINSREDVLLYLDMICDYYSANEPSSPVPILIGRARPLVTADFLEIIENLNPDSLQKIKELGGIKEPPQKQQTKR